VIITNFKLFCEARLSDIMNISGTSSLASNLKEIKDKEFDSSKKLVKFITLKKRVNNKKIQFEIFWNNTAEHNLTKRISERTSFKSVDEFNQYFKQEFNKLFPDGVGKLFPSTGQYSLYSTEYNLSIIMYFNIDEWTDNIYEGKIITVLPGKKGNNIIKMIDIF